MKINPSEEQIEEYLNILGKTLKTQIVIYYVGQNMAFIKKLETLNPEVKKGEKNIQLIKKIHLLNLPNSIIILYPRHPNIRGCNIH